MEIQSIDSAKVIDTLHNIAPDPPNLPGIGNAQAVKEHFVVGDASRDTHQFALKMRTQSVGATGDGLEKSQRFFVPAPDQWRERININYIVNNRFITFIGKF